MPKADVIPLGSMFGRLTITAELPRRKGIRMMQCLCTCGKVTEVILKSLKRGATTSCGCYAKEVNTTHGATGTNLYWSWVNMIARCYHPTREDFEYYGGKGIKVCEDWKDFELFRQWANESGHADNLTIERNDVNKDYTPNNCCWAARSTQAANRNKRKNTKAPYIGVAKYGNRWAAWLCTQGVNTRISVHDSPEEAKDARNTYIIQHGLPHRKS